MEAKETVLGNIFFDIVTLPERIRINSAIRKAHKKELEKITSIDDVIKYINDCAKGVEDINPVKREAVMAYINNLNLFDKKKEKEYKKINDLVLDKSRDLVGFYNTGDLDSELEKKICKLSMLADQIRYREAAVRSQKLINYAIWVSTDSNAIALTNFDKATKEFINAICRLIHADQMYLDTGFSDLELFDPWISGWNNQRFLINLSRVKTLNSISMQDRINRKNNPFKATGSTNNSTNSGLVTPIHFAAPNANNTLVDPDVAVDQVTRDILENALSPYTEGKEHWYEKEELPDIYKVFIKNNINGIPEEFKVIIGYHGYNIVSLIVTNQFGLTSVIPLSAEDVCDRIFSNYFYRVTPEDINEVSVYQSPFFWIYNLLDLHNVPEEDIRVNCLDQRINSIFGQLQARGIDLTYTRYRFESYNGVNDFTLISDNQVRPSIGSNFTTDNSVIIVKDNEASYRLNNIFEIVTC